MDKPLEEMSEDELKALIQTAEKALEKLLVKRRREHLNEARRLAAAVGYEIEFRKADEEEPDRKRQKTPQKFRNPRNHAQTWSGRGRPPKWVEALRAEGMGPETIEPSPAEADADR